MIKLQELRIEKNLSQNEVAQNLGITQQAYSRYEREERELGYELLKKFANFFDVSVDYLLNNSTYFYPDRILTHDDNSFATSPMEQRLILDFRKLPAETQNNFVNLFHNLATGA